MTHNIKSFSEIGLPCNIMKMLERMWRLDFELRFDLLYGVMIFIGAQSEYRKATLGNEVGTDLCKELHGPELSRAIVSTTA